MKKSTFIILGPMSGGRGGISTIMRELVDGIESAYFVDTAKSEYRAKNLLRPFRVLFSFLHALAIRKPRTMLCFASSGKSFYEKLLWCAVSRIAGCKAVLVFVDGNFPDFYSSLSSPLQCFVSLMMRNVKIGVQSEGWESYYASVFPNNTIGRVKPLVNRIFFSPRATSESVDAAATKLLFVGWVMPEKGIEELLDAFSLLTEEGLKITLDIVGPVKGTGGWWSHMVAEKILHSAINISGEVTELQALYNKFAVSDIFVLPSHAEGLPQVIVEAMAAGVPIVSTKVGAVEEVLEFNSLGLTVEPRDACKLADALKCLVNDKGMRENFSRKCRAKAESEFTPEACLNSYVKLLELT